jgi:hypothetical protein
MSLVQKQSASVIYEYLYISMFLSENHMKYIITTYSQNADYFMLKELQHYVYRPLLYGINKRN